MRAPHPVLAAGPRQEGHVAALTALARRPTLWVELGVMLTWILLALGSVLQTGGTSASGSQLPGGGALWICMTGMTGMGGGFSGHAEHLTLAGQSSLVATLPMLVPMAAAMMVPSALPAIWHVADTSLYWRRRRAVVEFVVVFVGVWAAYTVIVLGALGSLGVSSSPLAAMAALALAALWQLTPAKRRALQACHRSKPLPPKGWRATLGTVRFGLHNGGACLGSCWAMMLTMAFVGLPRLLWMAALTALITSERLSLKPRRASRRLAMALAAAAIAAAVFAVA